DRGCRAEFYVGNQGGPGGPGGPGWNGGNGPGSVTCESNDGRRKYCTGAVNPNRVSLSRQLSQASCRQGSSWGVDNQGLWGDRGCRAVFNVGGWNGGGPGGPGGPGYPRYPGGSGGNYSQ